MGESTVGWLISQVGVLQQIVHFGRTRRAQSGLKTLKYASGRAAHKGSKKDMTRVNLKDELFTFSRAPKLLI